MANLAQGGAEAFRALLNSVSPGADKTLSTEAIQKLSARVNDLVGGEDQIQKILNGLEGGELVDEEGLPIVDINEQASDETFQNESLDEPDLPLPSQLSPAQLEVRRRERNRILDLLEAEEEEQDIRHNLHESEQRRQAREKSRDLAQKESERIAAAKAIQKKMGKALLEGLSDSRPRDAAKADSDKAALVPGPHKTVSFADDAEEPSEHSVKLQDAVVQWGDVSQARLLSSKRPTLLSHLKSDETLPMKFSVVERIPGVPQPPTLPLPSAFVDSDDESEPPASDDDGSGGSDEDADDEVEEGEDLDYAQHQREVALKYHQMRSKMGQDVAQAMKSHSHEEDVAELPIPPTRSSLSRFRSEKLANAYNTSSSSASRSLGSATVLAASGAETLRSEIRMGKLDDEDRLVAGVDSDGSDGEMNEVMELIKKGEMYNAGPFGHALPVSQVSDPGPSTASSSHLGSIPPLPAKMKTSRFKASRPQTTRIQVPQSPLSDSMTPVLTAERSLPKLPDQEPESFLTSSLSAKPSVASTFKLPVNMESMLVTPGDPMSMIVESPSFPRSMVSSVHNAPSVMASTVGERKPPSVSVSTAGIRKPPAVMSSGVFERRPQAPPKVMSSGVMERRPQKPPTVLSISVVEKK